MTNEVVDRFGNILRCEGRAIHLRLSTGEHRALGTIDGDTFKTCRTLLKHRFAVGDAIGFNWHLMKKGTFQYVEVTLADGRTLRTTREHVVKAGRPMLFKKQGYELQLFLRLCDFITDEGKGNA